MEANKKSKSLADALFTSTQQRIYAVLFGNSDRSFYLTEIVRLASIGTGSVQRELSKLENSGLVTSEKIGNQKHYQANADSPLFDEIRSIVRKTVGLREPLLHALQPLASKIKFAFIYGSIAKNTDTSGSDVDLLIVSDELKLKELYSVLMPLEKQLARKVNPTIYKETEFKEKRDTGRGFLTKVLAQPVINLIGTTDG